MYVGEMNFIDSFYAWLLGLWIRLSWLYIDYVCYGISVIYFVIIKLLTKLYVIHVHYCHYVQLVIFIMLSLLLSLC